MSDLIDKKSVRELKDFIKDKFSSVVEVYLTNSKVYVERVKDGYAQADIQQVVDAAHPLKSSSGNLGLVVLSALCRDIEHTGNAVLNGEDDISSLKDMVERIGPVYDESVLLLKDEL